MIFFVVSLLIRSVRSVRICYKWAETGSSYQGERSWNYRPLLSNNLKVADQCAAACAKANRMLGLINRNIENKNKFIMLQLYKSLVRPHIDYCTVAWSPYYVKDKVLLEKVQIRFT